MGFHVVSADDAPGAAGLGMVLMGAGVVLCVRAERHRFPAWAARTAIAAGVLAAALVALLIHRTVVSGPLFPQPHAVPSVMGPPTAPQYTAAIESARALVRTAVLEQNLPGVSVAVAADGAVVWAEGFGWRDVVTQTAVTPDTRFNIGTAASVVIASVAPLGLTHTGSEAAAEWSAGHIGEPEEDPPPFTLIRHVVFRPIGLAPDQPLPGERATFYVPRSNNDPLSGRRLMSMRHLACCASGMAFYSTPSDLVRVALATNAGSVNGELAGGLVMSLATGHDGGSIVAVTSNIAHASTASLAVRIRDAFPAQTP
jgi:hypothetical protein